MVFGLLLDSSMLLRKLKRWGLDFFFLGWVVVIRFRLMMFLGRVCLLWLILCWFIS